MKETALREITPLTHGDCFTLFSRVKSEFNFPIHYHDELELNFIQNASGAKRMVGDHVGMIGDYELVLVGSNLQHGWFMHKCQSNEITEITIQFHKDLFDQKFLQRNQMSIIRSMFEHSVRGILFSQEDILKVKPRLENLGKKHGFESVLELLSILHELSTSRNMRTLSEQSFEQAGNRSFNSRRIDAVLQYLNTNFDKDITLAEVARLAAMTEVAFSRFFKNRTGKSFIETLNEIRLGRASRLLIDTTHSVGEIAYRCGFNNLSNFNRLFKKKKACTPKAFREEYSSSGVRTFV